MESPISLWVRPQGRLDLPTGVESVPARVFFQYDRFAEELGKALGTTVLIVERPPEEAPKSGLVLAHLDHELFFNLESRASEGTGERLFLLNVKRDQAVEGMDAIAPLGAVLADHYSAWKLRHEPLRGDVLGPKSLARALAPHFTAGHYLDTAACTVYQSEPRVELPGAVASYLSLALRSSHAASSTS
jgi:hypothetical protein